MKTITKNALTRALVKFNLAAAVIACSTFAQAGTVQTHTYTDQQAPNWGMQQYGGFAVSPGSTFKVVMTPDASKDLDGESEVSMYVNWDSAPAIFGSKFVCSPSHASNDYYAQEVCELTVPLGVSTAHVGISGFSFFAYHDLTITHEAPKVETFAGPIGNTEWVYKEFPVTPGRGFKVEVTPIIGDDHSETDVYVQFDSQPWYNNYSCKSMLADDLTDVCEIIVPEGAGKAVVGIIGSGFHVSYDAKVTY
ncbi:hypothetical protein [Thalassomonas actiniarum]|uniref:Uncharacterized protein n=1 Tax=Thalassomonas actiniarum TaxID=485447 RepID=A0AAF0C6Y0_9GAMM|nr:hypothetical protein [Thalassomonas actiniarum]WDE02294.1 hypothetical protein SG35_031580 [Thalassomonas actiniarum]